MLVEPWKPRYSARCRQYSWPSEHSNIQKGRGHPTRNNRIEDKVNELDGRPTYSRHKTIL